MEYLSEVISKKKILDKKINEIKKTLQTIQNEKLAKELYSLLDKRQSELIKIRAANAASEISIGGKEVTIDTAVIIRDTIKEKINVLTTLINNEECVLDKVELQNQRDVYYEDYILLAMGIKRNDLQVRI
jgi:hypothetical protein